MNDDTALVDRYRAVCARLVVNKWLHGMPAQAGYQWWHLGAYPNITSPAGTGSLLAIAREAWASPTLFVRPTASGWTVMRGRGMGRLSDGPTEAEALVAALEAAAARSGGAP